jgi:hypothetical protein
MLGDLLLNPEDVIPNLTMMAPQHGAHVTEHLSTINVYDVSQRRPAYPGRLIFGITLNTLVLLFDKINKSPCSPFFKWG